MPFRSLQLEVEGVPAQSLAGGWVCGAGGGGRRGGGMIACDVSQVVILGQEIVASSPLASRGPGGGMALGLIRLV